MKYTTKNPDNLINQKIPSYSDGFIKESVTQRLRHLVAPHVDSFNYFLEYGLNESVEDIPPVDNKLDDDLFIKMHIKEAQISFPSKHDDFGESRLFPREARERGLSYAGSLAATVIIQVNDNPEIEITSKWGDVPIMVRSIKCHLKDYSHSQLVYEREEANEEGGYFITNGIERVIRLLQVPHRNHAMALERNSFKKRGPEYSDKGVSMRCVRLDQTSSTVTLHYLNSGSCTLRFVLRKQEFLLPVIIVVKALANMSDKEIFDRVLQGDTNNTFLATRLELLLQDSKLYPSKSSNEACAYLGSLFRNFLPISDRTSDLNAGRMLISRHLFINVSDFNAKLECLFHMLRKLYSFAQGNCEADNADALMNHELLLPGHLFTMVSQLHF